jgi:hypothetical protein
LTNGCAGSNIYHPHRIAGDTSLIVFAYHDISQSEETTMPTSEMDYFDQKPDVDLTPFFETKGIKLNNAEPITAVAPPPKGNFWFENTPEEKEEE